MEALRFNHEVPGVQLNELDDLRERVRRRAQHLFNHQAPRTAGRRLVALFGLQDKERHGRVRRSVPTGKAKRGDLKNKKDVLVALRP